MFSFNYPTFSAIALLAGIGLANAQTPPDPDSHHLESGTTVPTRPPTPPAGMDMSKMMGGHVGQAMPMMCDMMARADGEMGMMPFGHVEGRIAFLKAELGITEDQLAQWNAFADALRGSAKTMRGAMMGEMQSGMPGTVPAKIDTMVTMMTARLDALKMTGAAGKSLYDALTDAQKKTADELMGEHFMFPGMGGPSMPHGMMQGGMMQGRHDRPERSRGCSNTYAGAGSGPLPADADGDGSNAAGEDPRGAEEALERAHEVDAGPNDGDAVHDGREDRPGRHDGPVFSGQRFHGFQNLRADGGAGAARGRHAADVGTGGAAAGAGTAFPMDQRLIGRDWEPPLP